MSYGHGNAQIMGANVNDRFDQILTPDAAGLVVRPSARAIGRRAESRWAFLSSPGDPN